MSNLNHPSMLESFMPLARAACPSAQFAPLGISLERVQEILASLLAAAAKGEGCVPAQSLKLTPSEIDALARCRELIVLEGHLVLLPRYAHQLQAMRSFFEDRASQTITRADDVQVREQLDALLPAETVTHPESGEIVFSSLHQRLAIAALVDAKIGILTGGPGTGKTTTAAALLALKQRINPSLTADRILVTAPTGKAACRIAEALARSTIHLKELAENEKQFLKTIRCVTLHRALEWGPTPPEKGGPFRRNTFRPLDADVVLVDEASMVDLSLMHALIQALPSHATLLLLGDSDQLRSVDVGGILAELVQRVAGSKRLDANLKHRLAQRLNLTEKEVETAFSEGLPSPESVSFTLAHPPLEGIAYGLKYSRRAMNATWILDLANLTRPGAHSTEADIQKLMDREAKKEAPPLRWFSSSESKTCLRHCETQWKAWANRAANWHTLLSNTSTLTCPVEAALALDALGDFQLLCSTNEQVQTANAYGRRVLLGEGRHPYDVIPHGCPLLVTANNRALNLSNGDVGIALSHQAGQPAIVALFPAGETGPRLIPIAQLPPHQPAFGITIHKSQGSEWKHIVIQLPEHGDSQILSRNLLYTAVTRSSAKVELFGQPLTLALVLQSQASR